LNNFILSIKKNYKGIILIIFASLLTAYGQMLWKISNGSELKFIISGFVLYGIGAVLMIIAFRYGSLSVLHPMMSFGYIFVIILGKTILKELITPMHLVATFIIICGVVLIGGGDV
jgi:drug/metabolite transporter (DMT)-like permease